MKFVKYPSIENVYRQLTIDYIIDQGFSGGEWCATNKIHGANYSFWYNGTDLQSAKRSGMMGDGGNFYGSYNVYNKYINNVREMYYYLQKQLTFDTMVVYGELFGGDYPHKEVPKDHTATKVQDGIFYCPHNDFYMFDVALYTDDKLLLYLTKQGVKFAGYKFGFISFNDIRKGTFEEMIALDPIFEDMTYTKFNLPKIEDNMSEGWVIAPMETKFFNGDSRVILKNKNPNFSEKKAKKERKPLKDLSPEAMNLLNEGISYVTANRLKNVLSHGHDVGQKDFGKLMGLLIKDAFADFSKDFGKQLNMIEKKEVKRINKGLNFEASNLIRKQFQNIVDGNY